MFRLSLFLLLLLPAFAHGARWGDPEVAGLVTDAALDEISGLAASRTHPGHFWAINDSGNQALLNLMDERGQHRGSVPVPGVANNPDVCSLSGIPASINSVIEMPNPAAMMRIIEGLGGKLIDMPTPVASNRTIEHVGGRFTAVVRRREDAA